MLNTDGQHRVRMSDMVEIKEIEPLFNLLANKANVEKSRALSMIGYKAASSSLGEMMRTGLCKRVVLFALKGLIADLKVEEMPTNQGFDLSYDEAELLFAVIRTARPVMQRSGDKLRTLQARIASHMVTLAN